MRMAKISGFRMGVMPFGDAAVPAPIAPAPVPAPMPVEPSFQFQQPRPEAYLFPVEVPAPTVPVAVVPEENKVGIGTVAVVGLAALVVGALLWKD